MIILSLYITVFDAFGKPGSAIMNFQTKWPGSYDECTAAKSPSFQRNTTDSTEVSFFGRYCQIALPISTSYLPRIGMVSVWLF